MLKYLDFALVNPLFIPIQRKFFALGGKISDLRDNVKKKRIELAVLRGLNTLNKVVEAQVSLLS